MAMLSLIGLYNYDPTILDLLELPEELDAEIVKDNILMETAELELLYPNALFMKQAIKQWSKKERPIWDKLLATTKYEYNPIWNKDGTITETVTEGRTLTANGTSASQSHAEQADVLLTEHSVAAYNETTAQLADKNEGDNSSNQNATASGNTTNSENEQNTRNYTRTEQGNIGVTSTQSLIKEQREVVQFNIIDEIINSFKNRFCILIY